MLSLQLLAGKERSIISVVSVCKILLRNFQARAYVEENKQGMLRCYIIWPTALDLLRVN